jgi:hypothetical protein
MEGKAIQYSRARKQANSRTGTFPRFRRPVSDRLLGVYHNVHVARLLPALSRRFEIVLAVTIIVGRR